MSMQGISHGGHDSPPKTPERAGAQWLITCAATVASTYMLDAIAAAAGLALVGANVIAGFSYTGALVFLAFSYVVWGAGLAVNLKANWLLLEQTGTSTNALSKLAHEFARFRRSSIRARRIASHAGYASAEVAKEVPYYAGAFGAAIFTNTVSAADAVIFLAGANFGAAAYEYGLARLARAFLKRRERSQIYAAFERDWNPKSYLSEYYSSVESDERFTIAFFIREIKRIEAGEDILYFGVGPTLHHVFLAAGKAREIHLGDYLPSNLEEIRRWIAGEEGAHNWLPFVRYTLECEGLSEPSQEKIARRVRATRAKIKQLVSVDVRSDDPLGDGGKRQYRTVITAYCADSATADKAVWAAYMRRISNLVEPGGTLFVAALRHSKGYGVGGKTFPSANIEEADLRAVLECQFDGCNICVETHDTGGTHSKGYASIVLAAARNKRLSRPRS